MGGKLTTSAVVTGMKLGDVVTITDQRRPYVVTSIREHLVGLRPMSWWEYLKWCVRGWFRGR